MTVSPSSVGHSSAGRTPAAPDTAPRFAIGWAALVYAVATLVLGWQALAGRFLVNPRSDQFIAGYAFRDFGAESLRNGAFAHWNPFQFGGMPYVAAMHGDIFYPTFLLRMIMPTDVAMTWSFMIHVFLAGLFTFVFLRASGLAFGASLVGGLAYMMGGNVAGLVSPGHDGKLYLAALLPLTLFLVLRGVRDGRNWSWGALAVVIGLAVLTPHPQLLQYLLLVAGGFALVLAFADVDGRGGLDRRVALRRLLFAGLAVVVGAAIGAIQYVPVREYVPFSPRAGGKGWEHAVSFSMPPEELLNTYLPQFSGILGDYHGRNFIHFHSEYLGAAVLVLAGLGLAARRDPRRKAIGWFAIGTFVVATLWALGGYTPFYHLVYAAVPGTKYFRAPSTMLYVVSFAVAVLAALGTERALAGLATRKYAIGWGIFAALMAVFAAAGVLTSLATGFVARPDFAEVAQQNQPALALGALRALLFVGLTLGVALALAGGRLTGRTATWALVAIVGADLWSILRHYWLFSPPASELYASDETLEYLKRQPDPGRLLVLPLGPEVAPGDPLIRNGGATTVPWIHGIRTTLGYHGNEIGRYQRLYGADDGSNIGNPTFWQLTDTRYLLTNAAEVPIPGAERVVGPVRNASGTNVSLFRLPGEFAGAWVAPVIVKAGDDVVYNTVVDPRFDVRRAALFDSASAVPGQQVTALPPPLGIVAQVRRPSHDRISVTLDQPAPAGSALVVSENYYPGWRAAVDGRAAEVSRADLSLMGIALPEGARSVELRFESNSYGLGKGITLAALALSLLATGAGLAADRRVARA